MVFKLIGDTAKNLGSAYKDIVVETHEVIADFKESQERSEEITVKKTARAVSFALKAAGALVMVVSIPIFVVSVKHLTAVLGILGLITSLFLFALGYDAAIVGRNIRNSYGRSTFRTIFSAVPLLGSAVWGSITGDQMPGVESAIKRTCKDTFLTNWVLLQFAKIAAARMKRDQAKS